MEKNWVLVINYEFLFLIQNHIPNNSMFNRLKIIYMVALEKQESIG